MRTIRTSPHRGPTISFCIEILLSVGRSVKVKKKIVADIAAAATKAPGLHPDNVMVVFKETQWENWSFAGGRLIHT